MAIDVTDATFRQEVLIASEQVPIVVDLWAPWCGPCRTLGPILERVVDETDGAVRLAKVNVDVNTRVMASFGVQSIPAVFAISKGQIVDQFIGALPEVEVRAFVKALVPVKTEADLLVEKGDEESLRAALELAGDNVGAVLALADILIDRGETEEALSLLARLPETAEVRRAAARARLAAKAGGRAEQGAENDGSGSIALGATSATESGSLEDRLDALLDRAREEPDTRQELLDMIETMDESDPRRTRYRKALSSRLF